MSLTIKDIAEKAGVSVATVSRVINGSGYVSEKNKKNIEEIIESLRPHIRDISSSTYYRLRKEAVTALSSVLWGFSEQDTLKILDLFFPPDT